jgi:methyltransferase (TIGR00027 family)
MESPIRNISDTARWVAVYRANETDRSDAVFRDPFARALAGERGQQILEALPFAEDNAWPFVARTYLFDRYIARQVKAGVDLVLNLAAGLDTRPYRMDLPASLRWVEVDLPDILDYKEEVLGDARPACAVERVRLDLSNHDARRGLFARIGRSASNVLVATEGLLLYLMPDEACALGRDLAAQASFGHWVNDIMSPGLKAMLVERIGAHVQQAGAPFLFAPPEGPAFFEGCGWNAVEVLSMLKTARKLNRLPMFLRMMAMLPESAGPQGSRPWSGVCVFERRGAP